MHTTEWKTLDKLPDIMTQVLLHHPKYGYGRTSLTEQGDMEIQFFDNPPEFMRGDLRKTYIESRWTHFPAPPVNALPSLEAAQSIVQETRLNR